MAGVDSADAPALGDPTDADLGDGITPDRLDAAGGGAAGASEAELTMNTPDELGGTGGQQAGGAG